MKLLKPGEPVEVACGDVRYMLAAPTVYDKIQFRRACARAGARQHDPAAMLAELRQGVQALMAESEEARRAEILALIDEQAARVAAFQAAVRELAAGVPLAEAPPDDPRLVAFRDMRRGEAELREIEAVVREGWPPFAVMQADNAVFDDIAALEAARLALRGWEGLAAPFRRSRTGVPDEVLLAIPPAHLAAIGTRFMELLQPSEAERKNSDSPSPSSSAAAISPSSTTAAPSVH